MPHNLITTITSYAFDSQNDNVMEHMEKLPSEFTMHKDLVNECALIACSTGNIGLLEYLFLSPKLQHHADFDHRQGRLFWEACSSNQVACAQFLIKHSNKKIDIHQNNNKSFISACKRGCAGIVIYLITSDDLSFESRQNFLNDDKAFMECLLGWARCDCRFILGIRNL